MQWHVSNNMNISRVKRPQIYSTKYDVKEYDGRLNGQGNFQMFKAVPECHNCCLNDSTSKNLVEQSYLGW